MFGGSLEVWPCFHLPFPCDLNYVSCVRFRTEVAEIFTKLGLKVSGTSDHPALETCIFLTSVTPNCYRANLCAWMSTRAIAVQST
jgi:hypothetical protein